MKKLPILYIAAIICQSAISPLLLTSSKTSESLFAEFSEYPSIPISSGNFHELTSKIGQYEFEILIDLTLEASNYPLLDRIASYFNVIYLTVSHELIFSFSPWRVNVHNTFQNESTTIKILAEYLQWNEFILASSSSYEQLLIANNFYDKVQEKVHSFLKYDKNYSQDSMDRLVGKMIKATGVRRVFIIDEGDSLEKIQKSFVSKNLLKLGTGFVISSRGIYIENIEFSLIIVESGLENAISLENYEYLAVFNAIHEIEANIELLGLKIITREVVTSIIQKKYPKQLSTSTYSLVNIQNSQRKIVGTISDSVIITDPIYFPGNTTSSSALENTVLTLSIANGTNEIYNLYTYDLLAYFQNGARYAVERSNAYNEIPRFTIELFPTDCGVFLYEPSWYTNYYSSLTHNLGLAYLTSIWYAPSYGNLLTLKALGVNIPQISASSMGDSVESSSNFPEFLKLSLSLSEYFSHGILYLKSLGWESIVVLATDDETFYEQYTNLMNYARLTGLKIENPKEKHVFPSNYTRNDFEKYKSYFQAAKDTGCRVFVITAINRGLIWEGLYDIGMRRGDFFSMTESTVLSYLTDVEEKYLKKREELILNSFVVSYKEFIGDLGAVLKAEMSEIFPVLLYMCMTYDTVSVVKEAILYILAKGDDYEDPNTMQNVMRTNKITGCLGTITFGSGGNSRSSAQFAVQQLRQKPDTGDWYLADIANIDKLSTQLITVIEAPEWPTEFNSTPNAFRSLSPCPFDNYQIIQSIKGKAVLFVLCCLYFVVSCISSFITFKNLPKEIKELTEKKIITFADMVFFSYFVFQFFQLLAVGPDQTSYEHVVNSVELLVSLDVTLYFRLEFEKFWKAFYAVLAFGYISITLFLVVMFRCEVKYEKYFLCRQIQFLTEMFLPVLGHICFLPIFSMLMNVFLCRNGISSDLTDSYLEKDCSMFCYTGKHKNIAVLSGICIFFYIPLAIYCRPIWEKTQDSLNINTKPVYLCIISVFQVIIVILNKTLKFYSQIAHGYTVSAIILVLIGLTIYIKPYNYTRATLLQCISLILAFWGILVSTIFRDLPNILVWILVEFIGFFLIAVCGLMVMIRFPSMLYSKKGKDISTLFLFQFCKNYEKYIKDPKSLDFTQNLSRYEIDIPEHET